MFNPIKDSKFKSYTFLIFYYERFYSGNCKYLFNICRLTKTHDCVDCGLKI